MASERAVEAALDAQGMGDGEKERYRDDIALCIEAAEPIIRSEEREALREKLDAVPRYAISPSGNVLDRPGEGAFVRFKEVEAALLSDSEVVGGEEQ